MAKEKKKIGELLIEKGLIDEYQLSSAIGHQKQWGGRIATILINLGFVDENTVASVLEKQLGIKCIDLENLDIPPQIIKKITPDIAEKYLIMPIGIDQNTLTIAMSDPTDLLAIDELSFMLGLIIKPVLAFESGIKKAIAKHYRSIKYSESYKYKADTEKLSEEMDIMRTEKSEEHEIDYSDEILLHALTEILVDKNIISKEELTKQLRKKSRNQ